MLLGVLTYGYATGVFSSRKLERATYDSVAFRTSPNTATTTRRSHDGRSRTHSALSWTKTPASSRRTSNEVADLLARAEAADH